MLNNFKNTTIISSCFFGGMNHAESKGVWPQQGTLCTAERIILLGNTHTEDQQREKGSEEEEEEEDNAASRIPSVLQRRHGRS